MNEDTLAEKVIEEVGPIPGHYLNTGHTRRYFDKEGYRPKSSDQLTYQEWETSGKKDALTLAEERVNEILDSHEAQPLPEDQDREIEKILEKARKHYGVK